MAKNVFFLAFVRRSEKLEAETILGSSGGEIRRLERRIGELTQILNVQIKSQKKFWYEFGALSLADFFFKFVSKFVLAENKRFYFKKLKKEVVEQVLL